MSSPIHKKGSSKAPIPHEKEQVLEMKRELNQKYGRLDPQMKMKN